MKVLIYLFAAVFTTSAYAAESNLTCDDFKPTQEALDRYPELLGACLGIQERNGELYAKFQAVVRRASSSEVTLYIPAVDRTMTVNPDRNARVLIAGEKVRARDLNRGQELNFYLSIAELAKPDIDEIAFVTEEDVIVAYEAAPAAALPTTASIWPAVAMGSTLFLAIGGLLRVIRTRRGANS